MNYLELSKDAWVKIGLQGSGPQSVIGQAGIASDVVTWVKDAWLDIQTEESWNFLRNDVTTTLAIGVNEIVINPAVTVKVDVANGWIDGGRITWLTYSDFVRRFHTVSDGAPNFATLAADGRTIRFNAKPTVAASIHYLGWKPAVILAADTDTPVIPAQYHRLIVYRAVMLYAIREEAVGLYNGAKALHDELMRKMMQTELETVQKAEGYNLA